MPEESPSRIVTLRPPERTRANPEEAHRTWLDKARSASTTVFVFAGAVGNAFLSGGAEIRAQSTQQEIEMLKEFALKLGTTVPPETLHHLSNVVTVDQVVAACTAAAAVTFFTLGTALVVNKELSNR